MSTIDNPYAAGQGNPYAENSAYEMTGTNQFFTLVQDIKDDLSDYNTLIDRLEKLQLDSLNAIGSEEMASFQRQIDNNNNTLSDLQKNTIKPKLQALYKECGSDTDKQKQAENLTAQFRASITRLAKIEDRYNQANKQKAINQYKIVNPDATYDEAAEFVYTVGDQQVFDNAIRMSNRKGEAMTVLQEVQARHMEVERTERLAAELNQLFGDLQELVFEQDVMFDNVNENVAVAQDHLERGDANVIKARDHARKGRKLKWIIFWVCVVIICIIVGAVVGGVVGAAKH
ncbi:Conserved hypothetical membrane protein [Ogataea parapolymorpha DL-1]|uniref:Conserved hypothetical membrane protein n=1 Tax=Ogataea parapolymorpha (strain ATCC 26012 / BCRC 20466 / JCM 22074 / NRRL Y-7560 / DL-1) TaxID=871575 RepID=W1QLL8_OGAPD|nr:Conserved hypothetical membrane protein [Ogataea parapolymorpha DL-1]ESX02769.1 Conserved hypothetical membrane protein [Ogataea parapolymorpha DL-1]